MIALNWLSREETVALGWTLIHFLWQGTAIALAYALVDRLTRRASTALRYLVALCALALMPLAVVATFANEMRISLLRAPKMPDPVADMGVHRFRYAIYPHEERWQDGGVVAEGLDLNVPFAWSSVAVDPVVSVDTPNLVLDTIKLAEREDAIVLRLYEAHGARGHARLSVGLDATSVVAANLLEASAADIDKGMVLGYRHPMGPLELTDHVGLDVRLGVARTLQAAFGDRFAPPPLLERLVAEGKLGRKSGQGFYRWIDGKRATGTVNG